eukprot:3186523-Amphidinium_carterae.3
MARKVCETHWSNAVRRCPYLCGSEWVRIWHHYEEANESPESSTSLGASFSPFTTANIHAVTH